MQMLLLRHGRREFPPLSQLPLRATGEQSAAYQPLTLTRVLGPRKICKTMNPDRFSELMSLSFRSGDARPLEAAMTPADIIDACCVMVDELHGDWVDACLLMKDLALGVYPGSDKDTYRQLIWREPVVGQISRWLMSEPRNRRRNVIYLLGKLSDERGLALLQTAFDHWADRDPIIMSQLLYELDWLGDASIADKTRRLAEHPRRSFQLAAIEALHNLALDDDVNSQELLSKMAASSNPHVRRAATDDAFNMDLLISDAAAAQCQGDQDQLTIDAFEAFLEKHADG